MRKRDFSGQSGESAQAGLPSEERFSPESGKSSKTGPSLKARAIGYLSRREHSRHELRQHGLDSGQLESIRQQLADTELQRAQAVWEKKFGVPPATPKEKARQIRFMASRGFSAAALGKILGDLNNLDPNSD